VACAVKTLARPAKRCSTGCAGNIDLQGTPFAIARTAFVVGGAGASGNAAFSANDQVVTLTAGGFCGSIQPAPGVFNPFNQNGGQLLALVYP